MEQNKNDATASIARDDSQGLNVITLKRGRISEFFVTLIPTKRESLTSVAARVADWIGESDVVNLGECRENCSMIPLILLISSRAFVSMDRWYRSGGTPIRRSVSK